MALLVSPLLEHNEQSFDLNEESGKFSDQKQNVFVVVVELLVFSLPDLVVSRLKVL